jgi:hypothetical protein
MEKNMIIQTQYKYFSESHAPTSIFSHFVFHLGGTLPITSSPVSSKDETSMQVAYQEKTGELQPKLAAQVSSQSWQHKLAAIAGSTS